ncbi:MAG TPA: class IV adenylate cyclase [Treponema sp.]|nr:class IV adenylate cyclase [Treponema sp.]
MTEVELKAHITDPEKIATALCSLPDARFVRETIKRDVYWHLQKSPVRIRIREEDGLITLTYKRKEIQGNIEVNDEQEFTVSNRAALEILLTDIGFTVALSKEKKTEIYTISADGESPITAEISLVGSLGWFLELEIILDETNPNESIISRSQDALYRLLAACGVDESAIEPRYYSELLHENP